ncbi:lysylphosphatidylglycerol synthase transmembrane domain-containing protein [Halosimplex salinum]|uniref:lysylphosphatidylglycerol synthase transmembrane domain-containing protein n=1 Tax=Halosimplex salinum TaxID=1710538 RepID=UPI0013DE03F0|nr:lysylphosphatidylglycerol synthase transmembrane domain-containing protein [Halosimplex salinum]
MSQSDGRVDLLDRQTALKIVGGFAIALVVLALIAYGIGLDKIQRELADADLRWLAAGCLSTAIGLVAWAKAWQVVLGVVGYRVPFRKLVVTYYAATFANYVTPLGQAGGEPFIAYVLSRDTEASYEDSLASVVTADLLNLLPFFTFAAIGTVVLVAQQTLSNRIRGVAGILVVFAVGAPVVAVLGWRSRRRLGALALRVVAPVANRTRFVTLDGIRERLRELNTAFERIAADRRALAHALAYSFVGWLFFALPLYFAVLAVGREISLFLVFFIVPASTLAGLTPSPGGLAGVEAALAGLLGTLGGFTFATGLSIAIVYRLASYVFAVLVGGVAALYVLSRS